DFFRKTFSNESTLKESIEENPDIFFKNLTYFCVKYYYDFINLPLYINWNYLAKHYPEKFAHIILLLLTPDNYKYNQFYDCLLKYRDNTNLYENTHLDIKAL